MRLKTDEFEFNLLSIWQKRSVRFEFTYVGDLCGSGLALFLTQVSNISSNFKVINFEIWKFFSVLGLSKRSIRVTGKSTRVWKSSSCRRNEIGDLNFQPFFRFLSPPLQRTCSKLGWCNVKRDFNRTKSEEKLNIVYHGPWQEIFLAPCDGCGWRKLCTRKPEKLSFRTSYKLLMRNNETPKGFEFSLRFMYLTKYRIKIIVLRLSISFNSIISNSFSRKCVHFRILLYKQMWLTTYVCRSATRNFVNHVIHVYTNRRGSYD